MRKARLGALTLALAAVVSAPAAAAPEDADPGAFQGSGTLVRSRYSSSSCDYGYPTSLSVTTAGSHGTGWLDLGLCAHHGYPHWWPLTTGCHQYGKFTGSGTFYRWDGALQVSDVALRYPTVDMLTADQMTLTAKYRHATTGETGSLTLSLYAQGYGTCEFWDGYDYRTVLLHGWSMGDFVD